MTQVCYLKFHAGSIFGHTFFFGAEIQKIQKFEECSYN